MIAQRVSYGRARKLYRQQPGVQPPPPPPPPPASAWLPARRGVLTLEDVRREVLRHYGVRLGEFQGRSRHPALVEARGVFVVLCKRTRNLRVSYPEIARAMRGEDGNHSTAITAMRRMEKRMARDRDLCRQVERVQQAVDVVRGALGCGVGPYRVEGEGA